MGFENNNYIVGVRKNEDETLDYSHSAKMIESKEIQIPNGWNLLTHGTNLGMVQWSGDNTKQLDNDILTIKGTGLSTIGDREREDAKKTKEELKKQEINHGNFNTTESFSSGVGNPLIINIVFPAFSSRDKRFDKLKENWIKKYGNDITDSITALVDRVYWNNPNGGQHPILPNGLKLKKLEDKNIEGKREITYLPEALIDIYNKELSNQ